MMRKWQEETVRKNYNQRLKNVKSRLNTSLKSTPSDRKSRSKMHHQRKAQSIAPQSTLIHALLTNFNLQEYSKGFVEKGYGFDLVRFRRLDGKEKEELMQYLQVRPEDRAKMETLVNYIRIMVANLPEEKDSPPQDASTYSQQSNKRTLQQSTQYKPRKLPSLPKKRATPEVIATKTPIHSRDSKARLTSHTQKMPHAKGTQPIKRSMFRFSDDITLTHKIVNGKQHSTIKANRLMNNLMKRLQLLQKSPKCHQSPSAASLDLDLQLQKIKYMYVSYDSATLTSNIVNLDLQELNNCLAAEVLSRIKVVHFAATEVSIPLVYSFEDRELERDSEKKKEKSKSKEKEQKDKKEKKDKVYQSPQAVVLKLPKKLEIIEEKGQFESMLDSNKEVIEQALKISIALQDSNRACLKQSQSSQALQSTFQQFSSVDSSSDCISKRFKSFDQQTTDKLLLTPPTFQIILDYLRNIIASVKMQKQVPIICIAYLDRLFECCPNHQLTPRNWRRILLACLVVGSKIWDDTSLENHSIAKVLTAYTTLELNHLEKVFLKLVDYRLTIDQKEYAKAYFCLRSHSKGVKKGVSLKPLDLETIRRLSSNAGILTENLRKKHSNPNKSF